MHILHILKKSPDIFLFGDFLVYGQYILFSLSKKLLKQLFCFCCLLILMYLLQNINRKIL